ncbi:MAG: biotin synthase BioB [Prevotella sp.]|nr:biotin synthase BioB [Bacteroides sp.]MCM1366324.1 biotin synthase BioB [Prevotella sp.]MCM1437128.1 biotin synthase BioB [Prevotella sp.]
MNLQEIKRRVIAGDKITRQEAEWIAGYPDLDELCEAADEISRHFHGNEVDSCSIVNARSGLCGENCKWCAQSKCYSTGCETYDFLEDDIVLEAARHNAREGIKRFSLVTSGRSISKKDMERYCATIRKIKEETGLYVCVSMGLIDYERMKMLADAGVQRYHCNMETSEEMFGKLCTSHTPSDKKSTIDAARKAGLEVCSGGIIGMGETMKQRIDFAFELLELDTVSVPINILNPIPGTPLENQEQLSEEDIIRTVAVFRFIMPLKSLRFAGGRMRLSHDSMLRIMKGGMNGVLMGDMLTTVSNTIEDDRLLFKEADMVF